MNKLYPLALLALLSVSPSAFAVEAAAPAPAAVMPGASSALFSRTPEVIINNIEKRKKEVTEQLGTTVAPFPSPSLPLPLKTTSSKWADVLSGTPVVDTGPGASGADGAGAEGADGASTDATTTPAT